MIPSTIWITALCWTTRHSCNTVQGKSHSSKWSTVYYLHKKIIMPPIQTVTHLQTQRNLFKNNSEMKFAQNRLNTAGQTSHERQRNTTTEIWITNSDYHLACKYSRQYLSPFSLHVLARYNSFKLSRLTGRKKTQVLPLHFQLSPGRLLSWSSACDGHLVSRQFHHPAPATPCYTNLSPLHLADFSSHNFLLHLATITCFCSTWHISPYNFPQQLSATPCYTNLFLLHLATLTCFCYTLLH